MNNAIEFESLVEAHRRELQAHCYRMMGSVQDAEDMVQETFLRAWRHQTTYAGRASLRAWLYRIATNVCLDALQKRPRRVVPLTYQVVSLSDEPIPQAILEPIWLEPYPDNMLGDTNTHAETQVILRENISLAFMTALHVLPARQRAILILRDVLDWQASEVATALGLTIAAVKSALHRARTTLSSYSRSAQTPQDLPMSQLQQYITAWETGDVETLVNLLTEEAIFSMPPIPSWYQGREAIRQLTERTVFSGEAQERWHLLPTHANRQLAFGLYRHAEAENQYAFYGIQVLTLQETSISDIITFRNPALFHYFNLPASVERLSAEK